ncbi:MAG: hypothetical protein IPM23_05880 [Candidatus Melainabacteria bacterium]|nr:hypothetical protein [Candidatus Melainabacteria bacterium]
MIRNRSASGKTVLIAGVLALLACGGGLCQMPSRPDITHKQPVKLESMTPQIDESAPEQKKQLTGRIEDVFNPDALAIPVQGYSKVYEIGLKLYNEGDFNRAMNAFKLALIRASQYGASDPRAVQARQAIDSVKPHLTMAAKLGYKTDNANKNALTGKVEKVFPPSLAWLSGLRKDDLIVDGKIRDNLIILSVRRDKKLYTLRLKIKTEKPIDELKGMKPRTDEREVLKIGLIKHPELITRSVSLLANYDCAILVDCSGSMSGGFILEQGDVRMGSRWDWCREQSESFYRDAGRYFPHGLTLVPFNHEFAVARQARASEITEIYSKLKPNGGTDVADPLAFVIDDYFARKKRGRVKPLAIAVLTDGQVSLAEARNVILDAASRMTHPKELVITFLSISNAGAPVLKALDDDMIDVGAAYDIVDTRYFDELQKYGLLKSLVAALIEQKVE